MHLVALSAYVFDGTDWTQEKLCYRILSGVDKRAWLSSELALLLPVCTMEYKRHAKNLFSVLNRAFVS